MDIITIITLVLCVVCIIGIIILVVRIGAIKSSMPDISTNDFNRLENRLIQDNRNERQELTDNINNIRRELGDNGDKLRTQLLETAAKQRQESNDSAKSHREELSNSFRQFQDSFSNILKERFDGLYSRQDKLLASTEQKLEEMRATVDEKLQKTLNDRLGQSFKLVSEQLESVQKGLGEMQNLANDVGGLKNALTNVKVRGNFGELQLKALLEQMLSPEQYDENVVTVPGSTERVEFAITLPGKDENNSFIICQSTPNFQRMSMTSTSKLLTKVTVVILNQGHSCLKALLPRWPRIFLPNMFPHHIPQTLQSCLCLWRTSMQRSSVALV